MEQYRGHVDRCPSELHFQLLVADLSGSSEIMNESSDSLRYRTLNLDHCCAPSELSVMMRNICAFHRFDWKSKNDMKQHVDMSQ